MPLKSGKSKETISSNIGEMLSSSTFAKGKSASKRQEMAAAAAYRKSREGTGSTSSTSTRTKKKTKKGRRSLTDAVFERHKSET